MDVQQDSPGPLPTPPARTESLALAAILLLTVAVRVVQVDQPIVENYAGRQVPTATVARTLERTGDFLHPQLDTGPFPNLFLVEPPVYQAMAVGLRRLTGWPLERSGRLVSALATALGAWGLYGLVRRRDGIRVALGAILAFGCFPITVRYGRSFQPDALMLGATLAGLDCWDRACTIGDHSRWWMAPAWFLLALGLAVKITSAFVLLPLGLVILGRHRIAMLTLALTTLLPAVLWYLWANHLVDAGQGSKASEASRSLWLAAVGFSSLTRPETLGFIARYLFFRAFTPLGLALAVWGLWPRPETWRRRDLWIVWSLSALPVMALLAAKLHHEYYWLSLAPPLAVGLSRGWLGLARSHRAIGAMLAIALFVMAGVLTRSTWRTPAEWRQLERAGELVRSLIPPEAWVVASEPLLFQADRRGCRLEYTTPASSRAAAEWDGARSVDSPLALVDFYRTRGAAYFADLPPAPEGDPRRQALHDAIRGRYKVLMDRAEVLIVKLIPTESNPHAP